MSLIFVIIGCSVCWRNTFIGYKRSNDPDVTNRESRVSYWNSLPVNYTKTKALNVRSLHKHATNNEHHKRMSFLTFLTLLTFIKQLKHSTMLTENSWLKSQNSSEADPGLLQHPRLRSLW